jgi:hypothetical protein
LESDVFDEFPDLGVVVITFAIGAILLGAPFGRRSNLRKDAPTLLGWHIYGDTTGSIQR